MAYEAKNGRIPEVLNMFNLLAGQFYNTQGNVTH